MAQTLCLVVDRASDRYQQIGVLVSRDPKSCKVRFAFGREATFKLSEDFPNQLPRVCFYEARSAERLFLALLNIIGRSGATQNDDLLWRLHSLAEQPANEGALLPEEVREAARKEFLLLIGNDVK